MALFVPPFSPAIFHIALVAALKVVVDKRAAEGERLGGDGDGDTPPGFASGMVPGAGAGAGGPRAPNSDAMLRARMARFDRQTQAEGGFVYH